MRKSYVYALGTCLLLGMNVNASKAEDTVILQESLPVVPSTTVIKKTVSTPAVTRIIQTAPAVPAVVPMPLVESRRSVETTTIIDKNKTPEFFKRITLMKEQVDLGLTKGWISTAQGDSFKSKLINLSSMEDDLRAHGFRQPLSDSLEQQITSLNIEITDALKNTTSVGTIPGVLK